MINWEIAPFVVWCIIILIGLVRSVGEWSGIRFYLPKRKKRSRENSLAGRIMGNVVSFSSGLQYKLEERKELFQNEYEIDHALMDEYVKSMLEKRIIEGFILTEATIPSPWNTMKPVEGFRVLEDEGYDEKGEKNIVAAVSAENIFSLLHKVVFWLGGDISVAITDHNQKDGKVRNYAAFNKDAIILWSIFQNHRWLIQNNGDITVSLWTESGEIECHLETTKLFVSFTKNSKPVKQFLEEFGLYENRKMQFFPEGGVITLNKWRNSDELQKLLNGLNSEEMQAF
ncbi:MAG: hypothetical protein GWP06_01790 [Actinobacteria bacterium]|nr:hypothetical protein [Actinomycetota bacterium]